VVKRETSLEALRGGRYVRVPTMIGVTAHDGLGKMELEWTMFDETDVKSPAELRERLESEFGAARLNAALAQYPAETEKQVEEALGYLSNDLWYHVGSWLMADLLAASEEPPPVWCYCVTEPGFTRHGRDTPLWTGAKWPGGAPPAASEAPRAALGYLANFARWGDPNGTGSSGLPMWRPHRGEEPLYMEIGPQCGMRRRTPAQHERYALVSEYILSLRSRV